MGLFFGKRTIINFMKNTTSIDQYKKMTETPVNKLIITLGIPTVISMLVTNIYNMADTYFVGTIDTSASGATGIVFGVMSILQAFGFMFGHGAGANISQQLGAKNVKVAREYSATSFWGSILAGLVIMVIGLTFMDPLMYLFGSTDTILPYARIYAFYILIAGPAMTSSCVMNNILRYEGKAFFAMIGLTTGGILNIFGDYYLVVVKGMGIAGAGLSTTVSQYISMIILLIPYLSGKTQSSFDPRNITKRFEVIKKIVATGFPSLCRQGLNSISTMVLNSNAKIYGDAAVAAISIVNRIMNFLFCIETGIGQGFQPVSAFNYGAGKYSRVKEGYLFALKLGTAIMCIAAILTFTFAEPFVSFFRDDPAVIEIGKKALKWQCLCLFTVSITTYGNMLFQSIGRSKTASFLASLRSGLVLIPVILLMTHFFGLTGLECAQGISEIITALITLPFCIIFLKELPPDEVRTNS